MTPSARSLDGRDDRRATADLTLIGLDCAMMSTASARQPSRNVSCRYLNSQKSNYDCRTDHPVAIMDYANLKLELQRAYQNALDAARNGTWPQLNRVLRYYRRLEKALRELA